MILHLVSDEKFTDESIALFEEINPGQNEFIIGVNSRSHKLNYVKKKEKVHIIEQKTKYYRKLAGNISKYEAVLVHYLDKYKAEIVVNSPPDVHFVWMLWGGDAYKLMGTQLYDEITLSILNKINRENIIKRNLRKVFVVDFLLNQKRRRKIERFFKAVRKIKFCTTVIPDDYKIITQKLPLRSLYIPFNYSGVKFIRLKQITNCARPEASVLIGNSGDPSNNHISAFKLVEKLKSDKHKIIVPLSYGNRKYIEEVIKQGRTIFNKSFVPLTNFLSYNDYAKLLYGCQICFMDHYRQQGMGTIIILLWFGAKLYLRNNNPVYNYLRGNGIKVFSLDDDEITLDSLGQLEKLSNKKIIGQMYDPELIKERARNLVKLVTSH